MGTHVEANEADGKRGNLRLRGRRKSDRGQDVEVPQAVLTESAAELQNLRQLFESLDRSQAVIEFDPTGRILTANANFLVTLGYSLEEIQGQHHQIFVDQRYAHSEAYANFWTSLGNGEFQSGEYLRYSRSGDEVWIQATYNPVFDDTGTVIKVVKFASDITAQKQSQKEVQDRSQAVIEFEPDGTIITANDLFLTTVGYSLDDIVGRHHRMFMPPGEADTDAYQAFWPSLAAGEFVQGEFHRVNARGDDLFLQGVYNPVFDSEGQVVRVIKGVSDISDQVQAKAQASRIGEQIAHGVGEMTNAIAEISKNVAETASLAQNAEGSATEATAMVRQLEESSESIGRVVTVIQSLSEQTNLLALNATIEAARAGESGRGFAVVANEVKMLANQTSEATGDIRASIEAIQSDTSLVVAAIEGIVDGVTEVSDNTTTVAAAIEEQSTVMAGMNDTADELLAINA